MNLTQEALRTVPSDQKCSKTVHNNYNVYYYYFSIITT